jgi:hypothetical protein
MVVIYEQQSWEGEIIDERDMKQGRGRPRKQYDGNQTFLGGRRSTHRPVLDAKLEEEGIKRWVLTV